MVIYILGLTSERRNDSCPIVFMINRTYTLYDRVVTVIEPDYGNNE